MDNTELSLSSKNSLFDLVIKNLIKTRYHLFCSIFLLLIVFPPVAHFASAPKVNAVSDNTSITRSSSENYYLGTINQLRISLNLKPLVIDSRLSQSAYEKGLDMSNLNYFGHWGPNGKSFSDFIWRDSPKAAAVAENLAHCFDTRQQAFNALVASPKHYEIMVGQYDDFGVAEVFNKNTGCIDTVMHFSRYTK